MGSWSGDRKRKLSDNQGDNHKLRNKADPNPLFVVATLQFMEFLFAAMLQFPHVELSLEQVREVDGEQAYEMMMRAVERASQEKARQARQVERARLEWDMQETARQSRERRGPERGGPERDFGPSR